MPLIEVKADVEKNRLYIRLVGLPSHARARELKQKLIVELAKLKPGFTLLNDSHGLLLEPGTIQPLVYDIMKTIAAAKPAKIARVVSEKSGGELDKLSRLAGYQAGVFDSIERAEEYLDE